MGASALRLRGQTLCGCLRRAHFRADRLLKPSQLIKKSSEKEDHAEFLWPQPQENSKKTAIIGENAPKTALPMAKRPTIMQRTEVLSSGNASRNRSFSAFSTAFDGLPGMSERRQSLQTQNSPDNSEAISVSLMYLQSPSEMPSAVVRRQTSPSGKFLCQMLLRPAATYIQARAIVWKVAFRSAFENSLNAISAFFAPFYGTANS